jgi:cysteine desulfurase/selenocysteine lyase
MAATLPQVLPGPLPSWVGPGYTFHMSALVAKSDFLGLDRVAHLAAGGETPFLKSHLEVLQRFAQDKSEGMAGRQRFIEVTEEAKRKLAILLSCSPQDIGFPQNVAQAVNMVAQSLDLKAGDNVVMERWEFPSIFYPWLQFRERGVDVRLLEPEPGAWRTSLERVRETVDEHTKVLAVSHVSYFTGERHDLAALSQITRDVGSMLMVDATHALGVLPVYAPHTDFLFSACYKWILGTHGVAVAYWNRERQPDWRPREVGFQSVRWQNAQERGGPVQQLPIGQVFELGNPAYIATQVLENATDYVLKTGIERIEPHVLHLSGELWRGLAALGIEPLTPEADKQRAGNIAFEIADESLWRKELEAREVLTWTGDRRVRFSTHMYNDDSDVQRAVAAVKSILEEHGPGILGQPGGERR